MRNLRFITTLAAIALAAPALGCTFYARDADTYKADTRTVLEEKNAQIKECYDVALTTNEEVKGETIVNFTVEKKTGKFINMEINPKSTAPEELSNCILSAIEGLQLDPVDQRDGVASFTWKFKVGKPNPA